MRKKLVVLFVFVMFTLVSGWASTTAWAHHNPGHSGGGGGGGGGGQELAMYAGYIGINPATDCPPPMENVDPVWDTDCPALFVESEGNNPSIWTGVTDPPVLDLQFFIDHFNTATEPTAGQGCFGGDLNFSTAVIGPDQNGDAEVGVWFRGLGKAGDPNKPVKYLLIMRGDPLADDWQPAEEDGSVIIELSSWEMRLEGKRNHQIACTDSIGTPWAMGEQTVTVIRTE